MTFTYDASQNPFTDLNALRLNTGDTNPDYPLLSDEELQGLINRFTSNGEVNLQAASGWALRAIVGNPILVLQIRKATGGGISFNDIIDQLWKRAEAFLGG